MRALEALFHGGRTPDELRCLALAQANKAAQSRDDRSRQAAFKDAEVRYVTWIKAAEHERDAERIPRTVNAAAARVAYGGMILSKWAAPDLDRFELTAGKRGETRRLLELLLEAREAYNQAEDAIQPLLDALDTRDPRRARDVEEQYLAYGVYDRLPQLMLDIRFNRAWADLYIGIVDAAAGSRRAASLRAAERGFQELVNSGQSGDAAARCSLGLAMTLREQRRYDDAARYFDAALSGTADNALAAQILYERARSEINAGRFDEARVVLRPLIEKDPDRLDAVDRPARFYISLAHLWDANSYLEEARQLLKAADQSPAREAVELRARRARELGFRKMNRLVARGASWPALVELFTADAIDIEADETTLTATELLFSARQYSQQKKYRHALDHLQQAAARPDLAPELAAEILFELGVCQYRCRDTRAAAETFERVAREHAADAKARDAVAYACDLWADIADQSRKPEDYERLADVLAYLLQNFPEHEKRVEAAWWLPVALQGAGRDLEAIDRFADVTRYSPRYDEAQYRSLLCKQQLFESERSSMTEADRRASAVELADGLETYAASAYQRAGSSPNSKALFEWSAAALVAAAELRASGDLAQNERAIGLLDGFEQEYVGSEQIGRVLAVRIAAYRTLGRDEDAADALNVFLQTVPPEQAGGMLAVVARGIQEEVERLEKGGDVRGAREIARQSLPTFERLDAWVRADPGRAQYRDTVTYGFARMEYLSGQYEGARKLTSELLERDPRDGSFQRLNAQILTAALPQRASAGQIAEAREAWGAILRDPTLRSTVPDRYWEARYHYLALMLREGRAGEVREAIRQEQVWYPALGGPRWSPQLEALANKAEAMTAGGSGATIAPSSQSTQGQKPSP